MGGDFAPHAILKGTIKALPDLARASGRKSELALELVLLGDERVVMPLLKKISYRALAHALKTGSTREVENPIYSPLRKNRNGRIDPRRSVNLKLR